MQILVSYLLFIPIAVQFYVSSELLFNLNPYLIVPCRARASELIKALDGQECPRPIACRLFADKVATLFL
jgi:hypothetical protein